MARQHPDGLKQYGIRLSDEVLELVATIQQCRKQSSQSTALAAIAEDAIGLYYDHLVETGSITDD